MTWSIPRIWPGETAAILGSGPSMSRDLCEQIRGRVRAVAVSNQGIPTRNRAGKIEPAFAPWADVLYSSDRVWWTHNAAAAIAFAGTKITVEGPEPHRSFFKHPDVYALKNDGHRGFVDAPDSLRTGRNSGYAAAHVAAHFGATTILLCGFDMHEPKRADEPTHWFGDHSFRPGFVSPYSLFIREFRKGAPEFERRGIRIINCTPGSALDFLPYQPIEVALREAEERREVEGLQRVREGAQVHAGAGAASP